MATATPTTSTLLGIRPSHARRSGGREASQEARSGAPRYLRACRRRWHRRKGMTTSTDLAQDEEVAHDPPELAAFRRRCREFLAANARPMRRQQPGDDDADG